MHLKKGNTKVFLFGLVVVSSIFSTFLSAAFSKQLILDQRFYWNRRQKGFCMQKNLSGGFLQQVLQN